MTDPVVVDGDALAPQFQFRVSGVLLLCPAANVEAVTSFESPVPLPRVPPHILGLVTYDQRALVLLDLARFLDLPLSAGRTDRARTLVVGAGAYRVGLPVESALGIATLEGASLREGTHVLQGRLAEFVRAEVESEKGLGGILDLDLLLEAARA